LAKFANISDNSITLGDGDFNGVETVTGNITHNTITFGNGDDDYILSSTDVSASESNNTITFGNGIDVYVNLVGSSSSNDQGRQRQQ
jgi:hypothetical protein